MKERVEDMSHRALALHTHTHTHTHTRARAHTLVCIGLRAGTGLQKAKLESLLFRVKSCELCFWFAWFCKWGEFGFQLQPRSS